MCGFCDVDNKKKKLNLFTDDDYSRIIEGIYTGIITLRTLDYFTYDLIARELTKGVYEGFGKSIETTLFETPDYHMLNDLRKNVYIFSGAKTYQQTRAVSALLTEKDKIKSYGDYKKQAKEILTEYNENYLYAEYNSAIAQARSASQWMQIEKDKDVLPMLTYKTVGDSRVRPEHAMLNNISRPVTDRFWDRYYPPNGWNCRCDVLQSDDAVKTDLKGFKKPNTVPDIFLFNAGKQRIVFSKKHPYFDVADRDRDFAKLNFNLPIPNGFQ
jgi:SPP1 gp7 family putative phage head morphogenesis protein